MDGAACMEGSVSEREFKRATELARAFHDSYTRFAPALAWTEQEGTSVEWDELPENNRRLMLVVALDLLNRGLVR